MTLLAPKRLNCKVLSYNNGGLAFPSAPITVIADAEAVSTPDATDVTIPLAWADAQHQWVKLGDDVGRILFRCRRAATSAITTSPVIKVFGAYTDTDPDPVTNAFPNDNTIPFDRLDGINSAAGLTLTCVAATDLRDGTYSYSNWLTYTHPISGIKGDRFGARWIFPMVTTPANIAGTGVIIEMLAIPKLYPTS